MLNGPEHRENNTLPRHKIQYHINIPPVSRHWEICHTIVPNTLFWLFQQMAWDWDRRCRLYTWWRNQMETFSSSLVLCEGNPPVTGGFPSQRPVTWSFDVILDLRPNPKTVEQTIVTTVFRDAIALIMTLLKRTLFCLVSFCKTEVYFS